MTFFGDVDASFWSSSSVSNYASLAWNVYVDSGFTLNYGETATTRAVCVR
jgi:hypothetical protein